MNYLAHLFLSGSSDDIRLGNFIGDSVKGRDFGEFPEAVQSGIRLHRAIDRYTDSHPVVARSRKRLAGQFRKFAGVVSDVFYDHYLALDWPDYSNQRLSEFAETTYVRLGAQLPVMPERSRRFYVYMRNTNALERYATIEGIDDVMRRMAKRTRFESRMEDAALELAANHDQYRDEFHEFFPQLIEFAEAQLNHPDQSRG
jgi:acyl carrier protein phosphodiesterase